VQGSPVSDSIKVFQQPLWLLGPLSFFSSLGSKPWGTLFFPSMDNFVFSEENKRLLPRTTAGVLSFTHTMFVASAFLSVFYLTAVGVFRRLPACVRVWSIRARRRHGRAVRRVTHRS
jgi:hypothetical protein